MPCRNTDGADLSWQQTSRLLPSKLVLQATLLTVMPTSEKRGCQPLFELPLKGFLWGGLDQLKRVRNGCQNILFKFPSGMKGGIRALTLIPNVFWLRSHPPRYNMIYAREVTWPTYIICKVRFCAFNISNIFQAKHIFVNVVWYCSALRDTSLMYSDNQEWPRRVHGKATQAKTT